MKLVDLGEGLANISVGQPLTDNLSFRARKTFLANNWIQETVKIIFQQPAHFFLTESTSEKTVNIRRKKFGLQYCLIYLSHSVRTPV